MQDIPRQGLKRRLHEIIFEADTPSGKGFDIALIFCIMASVVVVMLDSITVVRTSYGFVLYTTEWVFTVLFTIEYILRLYSIGRPVRYATSFFGVIDLLAIIPTYLSLLIPGSQFLLVIRVLRLLRVFRVLKLVQYLSEANLLLRAFRASGRKIVVFLFTILTLLIIFGSIMYVVEGEENGFTSIPKSIYWAIVTMTTVGYGDMAPKTGLGQAVASLVMLVGFSIIAVPTGIVTAELTQAFRHKNVSTQSCPECSAEGHTVGAVFCKDCGARL